MIGRTVAGIWIVAFSALLTNAAHAQDVPGIEICTVEKTMERRTSCLQSNIEFLQKTIAKLALDHQQKLDAAKAQIEALKTNAAALQKVVDELKTTQKTPDDARKKLDTPPAKETTAKDAPPKDAGRKEGAGNESGK